MSSSINRFKKFAARYDLKRYNDIFIFIGLILIFSIVGYFWKHWFGYKLFGVHVLDPGYELLTKYIVLSSYWILTHIFGVPLTYDLVTARLYFHGFSYIYIWHGCSGLKEMAMFLFIMILFPGPWKHKLWFTPLSLLFIYFISIIRIVFLGLIFKSHPGWFNFVHEYLFNILFFLIFFLLWLICVKYFYLKNKRLKAGSGQ